MVEMTDAAVEPVRTRSPVVLVVCAVFGLGALAVAQLNLLGRMWFVGLVENDAAVYVLLAVLVAALVAWHLWPRRSWAVLLVAGAVCTAPTPVLWLGDGGYGDWLVTPYLVVMASAVPLLLVGVLGVTTAVWRAGRRGAGAALLGATLVVPPLTGFAGAGLVYGVGAAVPVIVLVVVAATVVSVLVAAVTGPGPVEPEPRPGWQVTVGGAFAGVVPALVYQHRLLHVPYQGRVDGGAEVYYVQASQHYLVVGLVVLGLGLLAGAAAGLRVLVPGVAAGLLMGALASLAWPAMRELYDLPAGLPALLAAGALVVAVFVAVGRARLVVGAAGLGVLVVGLLVLWVDLSSGDPLLATEVVTSVLLGVAVVASVSALASLGAVVATAGEAPAAFAGVAAAVTTGVAGISAYVSSRLADVGHPAIAGTYLPVIVSLAVVVVLLAVVYRLWQDRSGRPEVPGVVGPR